jgi:hypothetical protein
MGCFSNLSVQGDKKKKKPHRKINEKSRVCNETITSLNISFQERFCRDLPNC